MQTFCIIFFCRVSPVIKLFIGMNPDFLKYPMTGNSSTSTSLPSASFILPVTTPYKTWLHATALEVIKRGSSSRKVSISSFANRPHLFPPALSGKSPASVGFCTEDDTGCPSSASHNDHAKVRQNTRNETSGAYTKRPSYQTRQSPFLRVLPSSVSVS